MSSLVLFHFGAISMYNKGQLTATTTCFNSWVTTEATTATTKGLKTDRYIYIYTAYTGQKDDLCPGCGRAEQYKISSRHSEWHTIKCCSFCNYPLNIFRPGLTCGNWKQNKSKATDKRITTHKTDESNK